MKKIQLLFVMLLCLCFSLNAQTYNATVAKDGSGTHTTVAAAIASAPINSTSTYYIFVKSGVYNEKDTVPTNRPNITMVGENVLTTVIYYNDNANTLINGSAVGTSGSSAFFVNGASFTANNITFQNNSGVAAGQAVAVNISGDKASFRNCRFLGFQDVLYCKNSGISSYFNNCYIEGTVDFIFGASTCWFENCYIYCKSRTSGGIVTAPNTAAGTSFGSPWGLVFNNCKINGASGMTGLYYLGRPWQNKPQSIFLNTNMSDVINAAGWSGSSAGAATTADVSFGEYGNSGTGANGGSRSAAFATMLNATQAANYTIANVMGAWDPCTSTVSSMCSSVDFPVATANFLGTQNSISSATLSWNMCWPLAMTYTVQRSVNGGSYTTISTTNGTSTNYNYSINDNSLQSGVNKYILQMTYSGNTYTSTDTITISNQPTITSSVTSLSAFSATTNTASSAQSFSVSGYNLTANITVTAPTNFQVSTNNSSWSNSVSYTQSGGNVSSSIVYVRLAAVANGSYSGSVAISTTGGTTVNVAVSGTTSNAPAYTASLLEEWLLTSNNNANSSTLAVGVNATTPTFSSKLALSDNTTIITGTTTMPAYGSTFGMGFGPIPTTGGATLSNGNWSATAPAGGPGGNLNRNYYVQFTITGTTGYTLRLDSILLQNAFYNTSSGLKMAIVYSKSGFTTDSTDVASGGLFNGNAIGTGYGAFANPVVPANQTGGPTNRYSIPFTTNTGQSSGGITLNSGETLTVRIYFCCSSGSAGRYGMLKNVQLKGSVTPPPPTISSFTPTSQVTGGSVVITGTNFSGVTAVSFGGTPATSYTVNSGTQITAVVGSGTSGSVSVTTGSGTATLAGFTLQVPTTFYNVANTDVTDVNNWGTNTDGTGSHPANFTDNLQTFKIYNSGATMSGAWTVSGTNSKISVNSNSGVFNVTQTITGTVDVENDGDLEVKTATAPTFGSLFSGSTVGYSGTIDQTITAANYYNLTLNGTGTRTFPSAVVGIANQFTINSYTSANSGSVISFNGTSPQTIPPFTYDSLVINNSNGCITQGGGTSVVVNKGCSILQNLTVDAGDTWVMAGANGVSFAVASGKTLTVNGTLDNQSTGTASWGSLTSSSNAGTAANADSARFVITSSGKYKINAAVTNAYFISVGNYQAGSEIQVLQGAPRIPYFVGGNLTWNTTAIGTASIVQQASNTINGSFNVMAGQFNNGTGGTARALTVNGDLNVSGGEYDVNGNVTGTSANQVLTVNGTINVTGGKLYPTISTNGGTGTINVNGNLSVTGGHFADAPGNLIGNNVVLQGSAAKTSTGFTGNALALTINNNVGVTFNGDVTTSSLTLTNGRATMGSNTLTATGTVNRTNGWVIGKLGKTISTGSNVSVSYEVGSSSNYLPVSLSFASVSTSGSVAISVNSPISSVPSYVTSVVSPVDNVNRYWTMQNFGVMFTNYSATFNYLSGDINGAATSASVYGYLYNGSGWTYQNVSGGTNSNTISGATEIGNVIFGNDCTPTTPTASISTASATVCTGNSVTFNATSTNGGTAPTYTWYKNGVNQGSGTSITFTPNSLSSGDQIQCIVTSNKPCVTSTTANSNTITLTVNQSPVAATFTTKYGSNTTSITTCKLNELVDVYPTIGGGVWVNANPSIVSLSQSSGTSSIYLTSSSSGDATISYTLTNANSCSTTSQLSVLVKPVATPNAITGSSLLCVNDATTFSSTTSGGVWSAARFNINSNSGFATATSAGTGIITYTVSNGFGCTSSVSKTVTINSLPVSPTIAYAPGTVGVTTSGGVCAGRTFNVTGSPTSGYTTSWGLVNSLGSNATINPIIAPVVGAQIYSGTATGRISVTYTIESNTTQCRNSRTTSVNIVSCGAKGIKAPTSSIVNSFIAYPNPAKNIVNIKVDNLVGNGSIVVTDLYGNSVKQQALSIGVNAIDVSAFAKGTYFISLVTGNEKKTQKLIVE